jgi:flagellar basal body rod protein FlgG
VNNGVQAAIGGMRAQIDALDILANNLANLNTTGFKEQKAFFTYLSEASSGASGEDDDPSIIRSSSAQSALNLTDGTLQATGRDLDIALVGEGFLVVQTPQGLRYTRNGSLGLNDKSDLVVEGKYPILDDNGRRITVGPGKLNITDKGMVYADTRKVGQIKLVTFTEPAMVVREGNSLSSPPVKNPTPKPADIQVRQGFLEQSNVNAVAAVVEMVGIMRRFEAISKSVNLVVNDLDAKSIEKLGH